MGAALTCVYGGQAFFNMGFHVGTLSGNHPATGLNDCLRGGRCGDRGRGEWRLPFQPSLYRLNLYGFLKTVKQTNKQNNPTRQHANLTFKRTGAERGMQTGAEAEQGPANLGGQLLRL